MARRKLEDKNIRKLSKSGGKSIAVTLPIEIVRELKWKSKQKVVVTRKGSTVIIKDWKK
ncbi:AbrB/MazE/SpoVT family DNA-binding domain-containing protein [Candidatus Kaiserbacteria bacterium]|nr:MAG: AbrB/MazE/SpoVT family DNA-binding domain-containing protein [Candidatus Kaiserbacteria bacterium]